MNEFNYKRLCPFKWYVIQNFPFIEADFDAITNYQLYCKVVEYLNKVIDDMNTLGQQTENITNAMTELQNYVNNYFDNLDVQDEINNKLDEMVESGQFEEILENALIKKNIEIIFPYLPHGTTDAEKVRSGNCTILKSTDKNAIIDLGFDESGEKLINSLLTNRIFKIDYIIISHYHNDHIGGQSATALQALLNESAIDTSECVFILPPDLNENKFIGSTEYTNLLNKETIVKNMIENADLTYQTATENQEISLDDDNKIKILNTIYPDSYYNNTISDDGTTDTEVTIYNNFSLVCEIYNANITGLIAGDIEPLAEEYLLEKLSNYDFTLIEHHSANRTVNENYFKKVTPKTCAIVCSMERFYLSGHSANNIKPERVVLQTLNVPVYTTYESGEIKIYCNGYKIKVNSENGNYVAKNENNELLIKKSFKLDNDFFLNLGSNEDLNNIKNGSWTTTSDAIGNSILNQPITNHGAFRVTQGYINNQYKKYQFLQYSRNDEFGFWYRVQYVTTVDGEPVSNWNDWVNVANSVDFLLGNQSSRIPANSNLNDYKTPNVFRITGSDMQTITNKPTGYNYGAKLVVISANDLRYIKQILVTGYVPPNVSDNVNAMFVRSYYTLDGTTYQWSDWSEI